MVYFVQNVQKYRRYKEFEIYVEISTGTTISQEMLKQTVNKNNIHVPVGVSQVSQLVAMILLINNCYVMSLVVIISSMNFVLYRNKLNETQYTSNYHLLICKTGLFGSKPLEPAETRPRSNLRKLLSKVQSGKLNTEETFLQLAQNILAKQLNHAYWQINTSERFSYTCLIQVPGYTIKRSADQPRPCWRVSMGWWLLRLSAKILAVLKLNIN